MKHIELRNVDLLRIKHQNTLYYGASQEFYTQMIRRWSGCGPTTVANQFAYMGITQPSMTKLFSSNVLTKQNMGALMDAIWKYVTPGMRGISSIEALATGGVEYGKSIDINLVAQTLPVVPKVSVPIYTEVTQWLENNLLKGLPVAFLCLDPGETENLTRWHWTLLVGIYYRHSTLLATIYDEGIKRDVNLKLWLETTRSNGGFVVFEEA